MPKKINFCRFLHCLAFTFFDKEIKKMTENSAIFYFLQNYSTIVETTPEPRISIPSRIAKRSPCSIAIGLIRVIVILTWSPGHNHFYALFKFDNASDVSCSEIELWSVTIEEWSVTATFFFLKNVNFSCEFCVWVN